MIDKLVQNSGLWLINSIAVETVHRFNSYNWLGRIVVFPIFLVFNTFQMLLTMAGMLIYTILDLTGVFDVTEVLYKSYRCVYEKLFKR
jgi:hypothetical protein